MKFLLFSAQNVYFSAKFFNEYSPGTLASRRVRGPGQDQGQGEWPSITQNIVCHLNPDAKQYVPKARIGFEWNFFIWNFSNLWRLDAWQMFDVWAFM